MCRNGIGLWNRYSRENVNPSFEPQPPSFMLKIRFLERSVRKYEKNCSDGHDKNLCWTCAFTHAPGFLTRKISKNRKKRFYFGFILGFRSKKSQYQGFGIFEILPSRCFGIKRSQISGIEVGYYFVTYWHLKGPGVNFKDRSLQSVSVNNIIAPADIRKSSESLI